MSEVLSHVEAGCATITLNRPEQMNAITVELGRALHEAIDDCAARADVTVIDIRGAGGNFCAGGDFAEVERLRADGPNGLRPLFVNFAQACRAIARCPVPVVAVVEGVAMAGGFELMQAADITLVADDARIADNHIRFGQVPGGGSTQRLARLVGRQQALGLLLSGDRLSGVDAERLGLAYASWSPQEFDGKVEEFLQTLAGRRRDAVTGIKSLVYQGLSSDLDAGLDLELDAVVDHISGAAGAAGVTTFSQR
ncbi:enoyl-CoA hydratase/isomerase family protein [Gordonia sp. TBRC 11910]|uniref:Enoyl-CoA hydratase/isomerase family protein n=1 Tax=Gordonia asplenii TaxID=2725283 RepID=A0A848KZ16_9ACTN|nr:enoyl-CoA hydratase/isomerase family protein [Gordonia asplenii]NMO01441.1 enoyl-CoA hydratase/isomerase family protein [Gordonia asplenii]